MNGGHATGLPDGDLGDLYERDFYAWTREQAALLRDARLDAAIAEAYGLAVIGAARETGLAEAAFPDICPFTAEQILDEAFRPDDPDGG